MKALHAKSAFRSRKTIFFCLFLLQNTHIKSRRAFASRVCVSSKARRSCSISPRESSASSNALSKRDSDRERERERTFFAGRQYFRTQKKILWKSTRAKTDHGVEETALHDPDELLLLERRGRQRNSGRIREGAVRAEENVYDGEAAFKAAAALTEAKGEAEKNERRNGARQTAERDAREKFGTERTIGSNAAEYAKRSAIESISSTCSERPRGHRGKRKRAYERGASSVAYRNGQTGETSKLLQLALLREARLEEKKAEKDKVKKLQVILNSNTTLLPQQSLPHTATLEQTNTIMVSTISSISNQAFEDGSNTLSTKRKIHLPTGSDESLQSPMKIPKQAHRDDVLENHGPNLNCHRRLNISSERAVRRQNLSAH